MCIIRNRSSPALLQPLDTRSTAAAEPFAWRDLCDYRNSVYLETRRQHAFLTAQVDGGRASIQVRWPENIGHLPTDSILE
jgi:hypothetical protein